jgi:DNA-directed RNA polymerase specialized sigma24 family protein
MTAALRPPDDPHDADPGASPRPAPGVNAALTPRRKRAKRQHEPGDKTQAIVRLIDKLAVDFIEGRLDTDGLEFVRQIEQATARLRTAALQGLHGYYSNADIAQALGVSRQAVSQARRRR